MSPVASFFWHDYETFGAVPRYDRPCQFAGIRTDAELNVIGEPVEYWCQPTRDTLPHPEACLITGITPQQAEERGIPEPQFIAAVLAELGKPGTCGVGYNSLRFDDEVTRHTAWRNFHDPYAREWRDGCSRWDIIDMVRMTYALRPDGIEWPLREDGQPSFKLELLATANGLEQQRAHDAISDVHATIALARLIREKQPRLYDYVQKNRDKRSAKAMLNLQHPEPVLHVSSRFPASQGCLTMILPLAQHPKNNNATLAFDLRHSPQSLFELSVEDIHELIFTPREDLPEDVERIPVKAVHANKCPILAPVKTIQPEQAERLELDMAQCQQHAKELLEQHQAIAGKLSEVFALGEFESGGDPEQNLYAGFVSDDDRRTCNQVLKSRPEELTNLQFDDRRLNELLFRYRARHHHNSLDDIEQQEWREWVERRLEFAPDGGLNLTEYQNLLHHLTENLTDPENKHILEALQDWGNRLATEFNLSN